MSESFSFKRFVSLFVWSANRKNILMRIAILIFVFIQQGWLKSKSTLDPIETMNTYILGSLVMLNFVFFATISKRGVTHFLLLPATVFEKFLYAFSSVFVYGICLAFVFFGFSELSARVIFSVSHEWFAFDSNFALWMVFTTSILFFIQFLFIKKLNAKALVIVLTVIIISASIFIDNYLIKYFAQYSSIRLLLYALLSVGFIGASYLQFVKCEATFQTKTSVLK